MGVSKPLRALVIGAGEAAAHLHFPVMASLRDEGRLVLAEICDIDRRRSAAAKARFGFLSETGDAERALDCNDIDIVYIFASAQLHHRYGMMVLEAGKHLFVEKPIAPSYAQACELAALAELNGLVAVGGHNRRFFSAFAEIRARAGKASWRFAEATFHKPCHGKPAPYGARTWLDANGIHALDALTFMMGGLPEELHALRDMDWGQPGAFSAIMRWPDGAQGLFSCNNNAGSRREAYAFHGPGVSCTASSDSLVFETQGIANPVHLGPMADGFHAEHSAFLDAIATGQPPPHRLADIAPSLLLGELIERGFSGRVETALSTTPSDEAPARVQRALGSARRTILITNPMRLGGAIEALSARFKLASIQDVEGDGESREDIVAAVLGSGSPPLSPQQLDRMPGLSIVGVVGLSLARHDPEALLARGIRVVNASGAYAETVADFAFSLAVLARRRAFDSYQVMRRGGWGVSRRELGLKGVVLGVARRVRPMLLTLGLAPVLSSARQAVLPLVGEGDASGGAHDLRGARVGLIGWGANAEAFTQRLLRSGATVMVFSEHASDDAIKAGGAVRGSLAEVLSADIVSLHRGLTRSTTHLLGAPELDQLKPGAVLINVARGALMESGALRDRLKRGDIFACLDTFDPEPLAGSDALRRLPNVFLTSHIAGGSPEMHAAAAVEVVAKVLADLDGMGDLAIAAERLAAMT